MIMCTLYTVYFCMVTCGEKNKNFSILGYLKTWSGEQEKWQNIWRYHMYASVFIILIPCCKQLHIITTFNTAGDYVQCNPVATSLANWYWISRSRKVKLTCLLLSPVISMDDRHILSRSWQVKVYDINFWFFRKQGDFEIALMCKFGEISADRAKKSPESPPRLIPANRYVHYLRQFLSL